MEELPKPDDRLVIVYNGQERELFMSYLRLNSLVRLVRGDPQGVLTLMVDPDLSELVLQVLLADGAGAGKANEVELDEHAISGEDVDRIIDWAQSHLSFFFVRRFQTMAAKAGELEPIAKGLLSSVTGSESSSSQKPAAGPSA